MRGVLLGGLGALALGVGAASAADLPVRTFLSPVPVHNWTGFYGGLHLGGIGGDFTNNVPVVAGPIDSGGSVMGGLQVGYNYQVNQLVFGVEGDFSGISVRASTGPLSFEETWMATLRGRAGYAWDRYLAYITLGVGFTNVEVGTAFGTTDKVQAGIAVGVGLEAMLWAPNWTGRIEYLYVDVPKDSYVVGATRIDGGSDNHIGRVAVNYKFW
jgi:outer membrane immunogenic protein